VNSIQNTTTTSTNSLPTFDVVKHTRDCEKEQRNGSTRVRTITTWDVVNTRTCSLVSECTTKREALALVASLVAQASNDRELVRLRRVQRTRAVRASVAAARTTPTPASVDVVASPYINAHRRIPKGRGSWAFATVDPRRVADVNDSDLIWEHGLYSDARRAAQTRAAARNVSTLWVCS